MKSDSLAYALLGAARAVAAVKAGSALPQALTAVLANNTATPQARGAQQDIAYRCLRQLGRGEALLAALVSKMPAPPLQALLCCALALLCESEEDVAGNKAYDEFTVVDQTVSAAAAERSLASAKGMVNAVLRRFLREREDLLEKVRRQPAARWNYPSWWIDAIRACYPQHWQAILEAGNRQPPLTLRVNRRRIALEDYRMQLAAAGMDSDRIGTDALRLQRALPVARIPGFCDGLASVQDAGAQLAAPLLDVQHGMRVLDACAAPGGKTGHLLECADIDLLALDSDAARLKRVAENLQRLGLQAALRQGDASQSAWWDGQAFDRILADVPCTASGIVRRHPDIRWLRRPQDATQLAALASRILDNLWTMLKPGGKLLLVTCSLWPEESEQQAAAFAQRHAARRLPAPGQLLPLSEGETDHDGLFYALFEKTVLC